MKQVKPNQTDFPLKQLYFYLTDSCNLQCRHCWIMPKPLKGNRPDAFIDFSLFASAVEQAIPLGLHKVKLTGGEPLIHPDIEELLGYLNYRNIHYLIETNGIVCPDRLCKLISRGRDPLVAVSLDGVDAATHEWNRNAPGCFEESIATIKRLTDAGVNIQIIMSVFRRNQDQLLPVVRLGESLNVSSVKFNLVQPIQRGAELTRQGETLEIAKLVELGFWAETELKNKTRLTTIFSHPMAFRPLGNMFGAEGNGCYECGITEILGVLADGSYALCGIGVTIPELVFGHAKQDDLANIWRRNETLCNLRWGFAEKLTGICGDCLMKHICFGCCIAQNYHEGKSLWHPHWYCEAADREGLFPESRRNRG